MRRANVYYQDTLAGTLEELDRGYRFRYDADYLLRERAQPVSLTLPVRVAPYDTDQQLHPFFDGLLPEGWLLSLALGVHGLDLRDRFRILLATGADAIGAVRVIPDA